MKKSVQMIALGAVIVALIGCGGGSSDAGSGSGSAGQGGTVAQSGSQTSTSTTSTSSSGETYVPKNVDAGLRVGYSTDASSFVARVASAAKYTPRPDPFALTSAELAFDQQQNAERVMGDMGGFTDMHVEKVENVQVPEQEEQPYRRLAGIIVGDSVLALIDMGNGQQLEVIRPGEQIPNTEWTVVSIDQDKAVLHRDGPIAPHTVTVRLETPPSSMSGGNGGGFNGGVPTGMGGSGGPKGGRPPMGAAGAG